MDNLQEQLLIAFAQFEERQKEYERARKIYQIGLDNLPTDRTAEVFKFLSIHEKKYGSRVRIENVIISKRKHQYEQVCFLTLLDSGQACVLKRKVANFA